MRIGLPTEPIGVRECAEVFAQFVTRVQSRRGTVAADGMPVDYGAIEQEFAQHAAMTLLRR